MAGELQHMAGKRQLSETVRVWLINVSLFDITAIFPPHAGKPYIIAVHPPEGWITGGTKVCIVGMNFYEGVEVVFGTLPASSEVWDI